MTIEVRQLLIKSTVQQHSDTGNDATDRRDIAEEIKGDILEECRQLIRSLLRQRPER